MPINPAMWRVAAPFVVLAILGRAGSAPVADARPLKPTTLQITRGHKLSFDFAGSVLPRPDDGQPDPNGAHKWSGPEAPKSPVCGAHFCVHWTQVGQDASNQSYAQTLDGILESEVYPCENGTGPTDCGGNSPGLGWRDPAPDGGRGGSDNVDVYIQNVFPEGVFGYTALDPGQTTDPTVPHYAYMVMDNDYSRYGSNGGVTGVDAERVTAAHEYNHVLQNAYDFLEDSWMFEATAVYMESKVYPAIDDYATAYVPSWVANTSQPLTTFSGLKPYGSAVWNRWLDHRFGAAAVRQAWELSTAQANFAPAAYGAAIAANGGGGFQDEFDRFSAAVAEWEAPGSGFADRYPDVPRVGTLPVGSQTAPFNVPHTTFAFFDVPIPSDNPSTIRLTATLPGATAGAIALVGRTGTDPTQGTVSTNVTPMANGGVAAAQLDNPSQYGRITAVVVDSDPTTAGYDPTAGDYVFTKDATGVVLGMAEPGPPIPATGAASATDHIATIAATVDPHLLDTRWAVEYGPHVPYTSRTQARILPASTVGPANVSISLTNLRADTVYHYRVVATNTAGASGGADLTFKTARDVTPPRLELIVRRQRLQRVLAGRFAYSLRCSERCAGTATLSLTPAAARRLGLPVRVGTARVRLAARPHVALLHVRLTRRARQLLAISPHRERVTLRVRLSDQAHNVARAKRTTTLSAR